MQEASQSWANFSAEQAPFVIRYQKHQIAVFQEHSFKGFAKNQTLDIYKKTQLLCKNHLPAAVHQYSVR